MDEMIEKQLRLKEALKEYDIEVVWEEVVDSTNNVSTTLALQGQANLVVANKQTAGSGRLGRTFVSEKGGLYESFAICLNDVFPSGEQPDLGKTLHFPLLAALGTMNAVQNVCGSILGVDIIPDIKWPNDLQVNGQKICGILCRAAQNHGKWFLIVGIGINVFNDIPEELSDASSLKALLNDKCPADTDWEQVIEALAIEVFKQVKKNLTNGITEADAYLDEVEAHCITIGKMVEIPEREVTGKAIHIAEDGSLCIEKAEAEYEFVKSGDVIIIKD